MIANKKEIKNISLTGFMGSGKSTVGKILSKNLKFIFIDLDNVIEISEKMTIPEIFDKKGEQYFRHAESEVVQKIYNNTGCVFSCGGGVILNDKNMETIRKSSIVVFLSIDAVNVYRRLKDKGDRPLLEKKDRQKAISDLLEYRRPLYLKYADLVIDVNDTTPVDAALKIKQALKDKKLYNNK